MADELHADDRAHRRSFAGGRQQAQHRRRVRDEEAVIRTAREKADLSVRLSVVRFEADAGRHGLRWRFRVRMMLVQCIVSGFQDGIHGAGVGRVSSAVGLHDGGIGIRHDGAGDRPILQKCHAEVAARRPTLGEFVRKRSPDAVGRSR